MQPRSPDPIPMDFSLHGSVKDHVYATKPLTIEELKEAVYNVLKKVIWERMLEIAL